MTLETRLRNTGFPPSGGGGSSSNSGGLAGTGGLFVVSSASPLLPNSRILTAGTNVTIITDGTSIYVSANTGAGGGTPGGSDTQIQVNSQNSFAGFSNLRWINSSNSLDLNTAGRVRHGGVAEVDGVQPTGVTGLLWLDTSSTFTPATLSFPLLISSGGTGTTTPFGRYQPTFTNVLNLDSITGSSAQYMMLGSSVTVSGSFTADPALSTLQTTFGISLPVAAVFANSGDLGGSSFCGNIAGQGASILADQANSRANVTWIASDPNSQIWSYIYMYTVTT